MPTVSVIIPTFNRVHLLDRALRSVFDQSAALLEVIVVDDGSTDSTSEWVANMFPEAVLLTQPNHGVSRARNRGIEMARGEWIAFLDSDDEWCQNKIETQLNAVLTDPGRLICHTDEIWIRNGVRVNPMRKHRKSGGEIFSRCLPRCVISPSSAMLHRSLFERHGCFDEQLLACEDYDLWLRLCAKLEVNHVARPLVIKYGGHADQLSRRYWGMDRFRIRALEKLLDTGDLTLQQERQCLEELLKKTTVYLQGVRRRGREQEAGIYADKLASARARLNAVRPSDTVADRALEVTGP